MGEWNFSQVLQFSDWPCKISIHNYEIVDIEMEAASISGALSYGKWKLPSRANQIGVKVGNEPGWASPLPVFD